MRYADADHVDLGEFRTRFAMRGKVFLLLGIVLACGGVIATDLHRGAGTSTPITMAGWTLAFDSQRVLGGLLVLSVLGWLQAWYRQVGTMWRQPLVVACAVNATALTWIAIKPLLGAA